MAPSVARGGNKPAETDSKPAEKSEKVSLVAAPDPQAAGAHRRRCASSARR